MILMGGVSMYLSPTLASNITERVDKITMPDIDIPQPVDEVRINTYSGRVGGCVVECTVSPAPSGGILSTSDINNMKTSNVLINYTNTNSAFMSYYIDKACIVYGNGTQLYTRGYSPSFTLAPSATKNTVFASTIDRYAEPKLNLLVIHAESDADINILMGDIGEIESETVTIDLY